MKSLGVDLVSFLDIPKLTETQNRGLPNALLIRLPINPEYLKLFDKPDYIPIHEDGYSLNKKLAGEISDELAVFLIDKYLIHCPWTNNYVKRIVSRGTF